MYVSPQYARSRKLALQEISYRMKGRHSAVLLESSYEVMRQRTQQELMLLGHIIVDEEDRNSFFNTAIELVPFGQFLARAYFPPKDTPFVLVDTSIVDFFGNISALYATLYSRSIGREAIDLSDMEIADYLHASAHMYFDGQEWESNLHAIYVPKLNYSAIHPRDRQTASVYALSARLFLMAHEVGHIIFDEKIASVREETYANAPEFWDALGGTMESKQREYLADRFAGDVLIRFASKLNNSQATVDVLNGVGLCLNSLAFMQETFPLALSNVGGINVVAANELPSHPIGGFRVASYFDMLKERIGPPSDLIMMPAMSFSSVMRPYQELIWKQPEPSPDYVERCRLARTFLQKPWIWDDVAPGLSGFAKSENEDGT